MAMAERTRIAIEALHEAHAGEEFTRNRLDAISAVSVDTLIRYRAVEVITEETFVPVSVAELVRLLNECAGDDCYGCSWEYIEQDGQAFRVDRSTVYRVM